MAKSRSIRRTAAISLVGLLAIGCGGDDDNDADPDAQTGDASNGGDAGADAPPSGGIGCDELRLPDGFCAKVFADNTGRARQMTVSPSGDVYVAIGTSPDGEDMGHVLALRDADGDGSAEMQMTFGAKGGNGIFWIDGNLFVAEDDRIVRYELPDGTLVPTTEPVVVVADLIATGDHRAKAIAITGNDLFVNIGSATNACQVVNRMLHSPGIDPCPELAVRAGIWKYAANATDQRHAPANRFATGIRNATALALEPTTGALWAAVNGRDQLHENWPEHFSREEDQTLPAEEIIKIEEGDDHGWPYCYFDPMTEELMLAPEYGGDGAMIGRCASKVEPVATLPAHWAPLGAHFYTGTQFPERYRNGMFIANHGSRFAPDAGGEPPGYVVVFQPFAGGAPSAPWQTFASGFGGPDRPLPAAAKHRVVGVAQSPEGALYVSDDKAGRIWQIQYNAP